VYLLCDFKGKSDRTGGGFRFKIRSYSVTIRAPNNGWVDTEMRELPVTKYVQIRFGCQNFWNARRVCLGHCIVEEHFT
jgi:hypothetical protein